MKLKENLGLFFFLLLLLGALWNSHFHLSRHNFLTLVINEKVADKFFSRSNSNFVSYDAAATAAADVAECVVQVSLFYFLCSLISQNVSCSVRTADRELPSIHSSTHSFACLCLHFTSLIDQHQQWQRLLSPLPSSSSFPVRVLAPLNCTTTKKKSESRLFLLLLLVWVIELARH